MNYTYKDKIKGVTILEVSVENMQIIKNIFIQAFIFAKD